ncbi:TraB/GumN family protein [Pedobacter africanus]|uniref:TraB family protein n=1 Tax=Pedobacter africanus TaxID=151894 RepID=A0A1W2BCB8_9SPHI|nr:TraB/GumN family protein [Pedobacter africanus]SMC70018.1 hypothetical protein SAMN04488524_2183 [Pedobacter africanus]
MKITNLFTAALCTTLLLTGAAKAQSKNNGNSLLWEVSGKGLAKPSYIFGTIHMMCPADFNIADKTKKAFGTAEELIMEVNFTDPAEMAELQKTMMSPVPLSKKLSPVQFRLLDSVLTLKTGASLKSMEQFSMTTISSFAIAKTLPCTEIKSYELEFASFAKTQNKPIGALETVKQQSEYFEKAFSDQVIIDQILSFDDYKAVFTEMIDAYKKEDLKRLYAVLNDKRFGNTDESNKWMLEVRNTSWAKQMPVMMKNKSCFFAVGSGHLGGKGGILQLLKDQGYTLKPILK